MYLGVNKVNIKYFWKKSIFGCSPPIFAFSAIFSDFFPKISPLGLGKASEHSRKWWYTNFLLYTCSLYHKNDLYKIWGELKHFWASSIILQVNLCVKKWREKRNKWPFFYQKSADFFNFSRIFQEFFHNLIKQIKIFVWCEFQLI